MTHPVFHSQSYSGIDTKFPMFWQSLEAGAHHVLPLILLALSPNLSTSQTWCKDIMEYKPCQLLV